MLLRSTSGRSRSQHAQQHDNRRQGTRDSRAGRVNVELSRRPRGWRRIASQRTTLPRANPQPRPRNPSTSTRVRTTTASRVYIVATRRPHHSPVCVPFPTNARRKQGDKSTAVRATCPTDKGLTRFLTRCCAFSARQQGKGTKRRSWSKQQSSVYVDICLQVGVQQSDTQATYPCLLGLNVGTQMQYLVV